MKYEVRLQRLARLDLQQAYEWAYRHAPQTAERWLSRFQEAIASLQDSPERLVFAAENRKVTVEIRELHFGRRPNVFRVIYHIDASIVRVLRIRRGQRRFLTRRQVEDAMRNDDG